MSLPAEADQVIMQGYLLDELTGVGLTGQVSSVPVALAGQSVEPMVLDAVSHTHIQTRPRTTTPTPTTGYWALMALATNDPDVEAYGGRRVTLPGQTPRVIQVPHDAPQVTVTTAMAAQVNPGNVVTLPRVGDTVRAIWFHEAAGFVAPPAGQAWLDADQITSLFATGIEAHDSDPDAHQDIRDLIGSGGGGGGGAATPDATTTTKGKSVLLGGSADSPEVPWSKIPDRPSSLPPSGSAGGVLSGSYPSPGFAVDMATQAELDGGLAGKAAASHGHTSASISDFTEAVQDAVGALLGAGSNVVVNYDDAANSLTISAVGDGTGLDAEAVRDAIGVALVGVGNIAVTVNDAADTITITTTATQNSSDAALRDRGTHTNTQSADTVDETTGRKWLTAAERTKLGGVATGATAYTDEQAQDAAAALLTGGTHTGVGFVYDDAAGKLNATVTGGGGGSSTLPVWKPNTTYAAGDRVLAPSGVLAVRKTAGTTAVPYDPDNWAEIGASRATLERLDVLESGWVPPAPGISAAAARTPDAGGPRYFAQFPAAQQLADAAFFPTAVWSAQVLNRGGIIRDRDAGINLYLNLYGGSAALAFVGADGTMPVVLQAGESAPHNWAQLLTDNPALPGAERVVGWKLYDEVDMTSGATTDGIPKLDARLATLPPGDGRFRYNNVGKGVAFWETEQSAARFVNYQHVTSIDLYWFTDNDLYGEYQGGQLVFTDGDATAQAALTPDQAHLGINYGFHIRRMRRLTKPARSRPIWGFVELGHPFTDNSWPTITGPEIASAAWHQIIAGATGIIYFNHSFGGQVTSEVLRDPNYAAIRAAVAALNARFRDLARVLNAPTIDGWGLATSGGKVATSVRMVGGRYYLLAASGQRASATVTFTLPAGITATHATPVHEARTGIAITSGAFTDTFADHNAVHIYRLDGAQVTSPAPTVTEHKVFDAFGTGRTSTTTLGTPDIGPAWATTSGAVGVDANGEAYRVGGSDRFARINSVGAGAAASRVVSALVGASPRDVGLNLQTDSSGFNGYLINFDPGDGRLQVEKWGAGTLLRARAPQPGTRVDVRLGAAGAHEISYDGVLVGSFTDTSFTGGYDGLYMKEVGAGRIREFAVRS